MNKRRFIAAMLVAVAVVGAAGAILASNMGFKLNYTLQATLAGTSKTGRNTLALPFNAQTNLLTAKNLIDDIGPLANTQSVQRYLKNTDLFQAYTGRTGTQGNWNLAKGEGLLVRMNSTVNYIVVGSHDPSLSLTLQATLAGTSKTGRNLYAYPYHSTAATAKALIDDIGALANTQSVQRYLKNTDLFQAYTGRTGTQGNWNLVPGEAYLVRMNSTVNYIPSHY